MLTSVRIRRVLDCQIGQQPCGRAFGCRPCIVPSAPCSKRSAVHPPVEQCWGGCNITTPTYWSSAITPRAAAVQVAAHHSSTAATALIASGFSPDELMLLHESLTTMFEGEPIVLVPVTPQLLDVHAAQLPSYIQDHHTNQQQQQMTDHTLQWCGAST